MKHLKYEEFEKLHKSEGAWVELPNHVKTADWKAYPNTVLERIDVQLGEFGLEIVEYETGADYFAWKVAKK
jgi:hypothetical protein